MREKVMAFNAKVEARMMKKLRGVWLDPIFGGIFALMCAASLAGGLYLEKETLFYSAAIWALATLLCLRRIRRIRRGEKENGSNQHKTEEIIK